MINVILTLCLFILSNMVYVFYDVINFPFTGHFGACGPLLPRVQTSIPAIHHCLCIVLQNDVKISNVSYDVIIMLIAPILYWALYVIHTEVLCTLGSSQNLLA